MRNLVTYQNGACVVVIKPNGTKIRYTDSRHGFPYVKFPESIDLKITNYCDAGCHYCHEASTTKGKHAKLSDIVTILNQLAPGTEIAVGGGNPLSHPNLKEIIQEAAKRGIIINVTVNEYHIDELLKNRNDYFGVSGWGISPSVAPNWRKIEKVCDELEHVVIHLIDRIHTNGHLYTIAKHIKDPKVLILGYKEYGFGRRLVREGADSRFIQVTRDKQQISAEYSSWSTLTRWCSMLGNMTISFDNLALDQLDVETMIKYERDDYMQRKDGTHSYMPAFTSQELASRFNWEAVNYEDFFMGIDGQYTMYIDAVTMSYSVASSMSRKPLGDLTVEEAFEHVRAFAERKHCLLMQEKAFEHLPWHDERRKQATTNVDDHYKSWTGNTSNT